MLAKQRRAKRKTAMRKRAKQKRAKARMRRREGQKTDQQTYQGLAAVSVRLGTSAISDRVWKSCLTGGGAKDHAFV